MALSPQNLSSILSSNLSFNNFNGISKDQLSNAVSLGFYTYVTSAVKIITIDTGVIGTGIGNGTGLVLSPYIVYPSVFSSLSSTGVNGVHMPALANAISMSISTYLTMCSLSTFNTGVGTGTGIVSVITSTPVHISSMIASFLSNGINGPFSIPLATAIANGIDAVLPLSTGIVFITGLIGPSPGAGVGFGVIS